MISRRNGSAVAAAGRKSAPRGARPVCRGKVTKSSAIPPPPARFFCIGARWFAVLRGLCSRRASGGRKVARFSSPSPSFFVIRPRFFRSAAGSPFSAGVKCAVPRARVSHTRQSLFVFFLHRFTHPAQHADYLHIAGEGFVFSSSPRSALPHGDRHSGQQAQWARREIGQFLLTLR